jgi:hypothetical protein
MNRGRGPSASVPHTQAGCLSLFDTGVLNALVRQAAYSLAVCRALFVHPFSTRTFAHGAPAEAARA